MTIAVTARVRFSAEETMPAARSDSERPAINPPITSGDICAASPPITCAAMAPTTRNTGSRRISAIVGGSLSSRAGASSRSGQRGVNRSFYRRRTEKPGVPRTILTYLGASGAYMGFHSCPVIGGATLINGSADLGVAESARLTWALALRKHVRRCWSSR